MILLLGIIPFFGSNAFAGGGFVSPQSSQVFGIDSGLIIQEIDEKGNSVFMQHVLTNNYGIQVDVTISSFQSANFLKIDETCKTLTLFTNHILVIPYSPVPISELGRYVMLPALAQYEHPETLEESEIFLKKYNLILDDGENAGFTTSVDFSCDDVYVEMNPRYEHAFDDNLGMQSQSGSSSQQNGQHGSQQNGQQSSTNLTPQEQEILQQADELLREYQMAAELQNSPVNPTERPFLVEQDTEQFREEIMEQMQLQEQFMQQLQQNPDFQNFDEQLSNEGLIQQPPSFDMSDEQALVSVPYENDDDATASISAEFQNSQITNVSLERPEAEIETNLLWFIPLVIGIIAVAILISKKQLKSKSKPVTKIPLLVKNDNYTISYVDLTREMLREAQHLYDEDLFKDAHEKLSQAIRFYYSNRLYNGTEMTNMDTLQLLRKQNIPEFDTILNYLNMCEMIEFAKNPTQRKNFYSATEKFSQIIE
ncbi:MAG: hypothetical protein VX587_00940 [Thermoproteota archaeon]|nr:hypothetical protein [Thermoproteota archaeon]